MHGYEPKIELTLAHLNSMFGEVDENRDILIEKINEQDKLKGGNGACFRIKRTDYLSNKNKML